MRHLPMCIEYMTRLQHTDVFRFCAIPQIMSIGTLSLCYNNGAVFEGARRCLRPVRLHIDCAAARQAQNHTPSCHTEHCRCLRVF